MKTACIGVGNVGRSWAIVFARAGHQVHLWDKDPQALINAQSQIHIALQGLASFDDELDVEQVCQRIQCFDSMVDAVKDVDYIQESAAETIQVKKELFASLDQYADKQALIASSTSAIPASDFLDNVEGRHRCLIVHPVNPPHMVPLVEICKSPWTSNETVEQAKSMMLDLGQSPIILNKEIEGFALNRLQWALFAEAMHLVGEGYCSVEDIDKVLTQGLALRWSFIGPFEVCHLNSTQGLKGYFHTLKDALDRVQNSLRTDYQFSDEQLEKAHNTLSKNIPVDDIPQYQSWRDQRLAKLRQHLNHDDNQ